MKNFNLQMFAASNDAVKGSRIIYLFRKLSEAGTSAARNIAFTTENSRSVSRDVDTTITKNGALRTPGEAEVEITVTALLAKDGSGGCEYLEGAIYDAEIIEIWEANLDNTYDEDKGTYCGKYYQGYITEYEITSNAEDFVEVSITFAINGTGVYSDAENATGITVSENQLKIASYVFADTTAPKGA